MSCTMSKVGKQEVSETGCSSVSSKGKEKRKGEVPRHAGTNPTLITAPLKHL